MKDPQKLLQEIKEMNTKTKKKLDEIDAKMAEIDLEYAKLLIKENIDNLKIAKKILSAEM